MQPVDDKQSSLDQAAAVSPYHIQLDAFEGPLDLLLHLIRDNQIDIYDIPIAFITRQYLDHIQMMEELDLEIAGEFLVMASTLMQIKSKMLIPAAPAEEDELDEGQDPREELVRRLLDYQKYKDAAARLDERPILGRDVFARKVRREKVKRPSQERELAQVSVFKLMEAFQRLAQKLEQAHAYHQVDLEPISVIECAENVRDMILQSKEGTVAFPHIFQGRKTRLRVVVTFLALLDLIKRGYIRVFQADTFSNIEVIGTDQIYQNWDYSGADEYAGPGSN